MSPPKACISLTLAELQMLERALVAAHYQLSERRGAQILCDRIYSAKQGVLMSAAENIPALIDDAGVSR